MPRGTADISREHLLQAFDPLLATIGRDDLLAYLQQHSGILIAREQDRFAFPHRSFQEYLAMGWLTARTDDALSREVCADPLWWREVFLLAVTEQRRKPRFAISYIDGLLQLGESRPEVSRHRLFVLGGLGLMELGLIGWESQDFPRQREAIRRGIVDLIHDANALNVEERAEAGRVLGRIGDPRRGVGLTKEGLPDIDWVKILGGEVALEHDTGRFAVEPFYMARYPVTNGQSQAFLDDPEGYNNARWWAGLDEQPGTPESPSWNEPNHPRETVSWFETMAFCAWLSHRLGYDIRLPREWEWQQAACSGNPDFEFPWGQEYRSGYANINEIWGDVGPHRLYRTTAVGSIRRVIRSRAYQT